MLHYCLGQISVGSFRFRTFLISWGLCGMFSNVPVCLPKPPKTDERSGSSGNTEQRWNKTAVKICPTRSSSLMRWREPFSTLRGKRKEREVKRGWDGEMEMAQEEKQEAQCTSHMKALILPLITSGARTGQEGANRRQSWDWHSKAQTQTRERQLSWVVGFKSTLFVVGTQWAATVWLSCVC